MAKHDKKLEDRASARLRQEPLKQTSSEWKDKSVLITGGAGSFGKKFIEVMLRESPPRKMIVFSRDELKQHEMRLSGFDCPELHYFIGDVRDKDRLKRAMRGVDIVVHAAALKQIEACEYNPLEAILTNVLGARNVIEAALDSGVKKVVALSTDKAVNPVSLYGATKLCAEKLFVQSNSYSGAGETSFSCVRYGNVIGSRGSLIPLLMEQRKRGRITITDARMSRFCITLEQAVRFVIRCIDRMHGGEVFVPKIPSVNIMDVVRAIAPECEVEYIGIRPGEKLHEVLIAEDETRQTVELGEMFIIHPAHRWRTYVNRPDAKLLEEDFLYTSKTNGWRLTAKELAILLGNFSGKKGRYVTNLSSPPSLEVSPP